MTEQFVSGRDVFVSLPTGSGKSVCYGCLPLDGSASKKSVAGGTVCACVRAHKGRTGIRNETAYWSHDNHALRHSMFAQKNQETLRKRPDSLFGRVHVRVWDRDYMLLVSVPDSHVHPPEKRVWSLSKDFLVVLSQHVRKTGKPIRTLV